MPFGDEFNVDLTALLGVDDMPAGVFDAMIAYATDPSAPLADIALIPVASDLLFADDWADDDSDALASSSDDDDDDDSDYADNDYDADNDF